MAYILNLQSLVLHSVQQAVNQLYHTDLPDSLLQIQETRKEFEGDLTLVVFPLLRMSRKSPEATAQELGAYLEAHCEVIEKFNVIKGFLNLVVSRSFWGHFLFETEFDDRYGTKTITEQSQTVMIEYSSPNTNKPLHLGHIRNNLLGHSLAQIMAANGHRVIKVNLVNDRGIHICKSMLAWQLFGNGETPESSGKKGDHLVGEYYVRFDKEYKKEIKELTQQGMTEEEAAKKAPMILKAQEMLLLWEAKDPETIALWTLMNGWVYDGFKVTYQNLGVDFDHIYYESNTYLSGKQIVAEGLKQGIFVRKEDGSVWCDLTGDGLDEKLLLRSDGTSVYMTQDIGTACERFAQYPINQHIYVVGNEQNYHFQVLTLILGKLGYSWAKDIQHMSYGMVELPSGKMKSREGTVVDADDLIEEMVNTARDMSQQLGKLDGYTPEQAACIYNIIGKGALKYFILKVDPRKNMMFDPQESIDFNGNTGPFIQYSYARIRSILRKAGEMGIAQKQTVVPEDTAALMNEKEISMVKLLYRYPAIIQDAGSTLSPALIANYVFELAKEFNQFYHECPILKEENNTVQQLRLLLCASTATVIKSSMNLMGIEVPERM